MLDIFRGLNQIAAMRLPQKQRKKASARQEEKQLREKSFESAYAHFIRAYINGKLKQAGLSHVNVSVLPAPKTTRRVLMFSVNEKRGEEARVSKIMDDAERIAQRTLVDGVAQLRLDAVRFAETLRREAARL